MSEKEIVKIAVKRIMDIPKPNPFDGEEWRHYADTIDNVITYDVLAQLRAELVSVTAERDAMRVALEAARKQVDDDIAEIESDERYHYESANIRINAPLALIQVGMKSRMAVLKKLRAALAAKG